MLADVSIICSSAFISDKKLSKRGNMSNTTQVALVTGGGRGLGRAFAQGLAAQGMAVAVTSRTQAELDNTVELIVQAGGRVMAFAGDVTDAQSVNQIVAEVERQLGPIDVLINNAGVLRALGIFTEVDPDLWWREIEINLQGPFLFAREVGMKMKARRCGRIINVASMAGTGAIPGGSAYCVSKAALIRLTEQMAIELTDFNVVALAYHPGTVRTPMNDYLLSQKHHLPLIPWFPKIFEDNLDVPIEKSTGTLIALATGAADALSGCMINVDDDLPALVAQGEAILQDGRRMLRMKF